MKKLLIIQRTLEHYRLEVFENLARRQGIDLNIAYSFSESIKMDLQKEKFQFSAWDFIYKRIKLPVSQEVFFYQNWKTILHDIKPDYLIMEANPRVLNLRFILDYCDKNNIKKIAWTKYSSVNKWPKSIFWKNMIHKWDKFICYGRDSKEGLLEIGISSSDLFVAQNTVPIPMNDDELHALQVEGKKITADLYKNDMPLVVSLGTLVKKKKFDDVIKAAVALMSDGTDFSLVIVGDGPERRYLAKFAAKSLKEAELPSDRIKFIGRVPNGHDAFWLSVADVSVMGGATGLALNVSMGSGTATLIADEPGSDAELLEHRNNGLRYKAGDVLDLRRNIELLIKNADFANKLGTKARETVLERATVPRMVDGFMNAIE